jgi:thiol:disulfide interchange protein DsbC
LRLPQSSVCQPLADEASVKKAVETKLERPVTSVTKTPYLGLYEVYVDGQIVYTDEKVSALLLGALIDGKTMKNVTDERMQKLTAIKFSDLPLALAVKQVRGDGKRVFATFEDPNCGYCKKMAKDIAKLDNVTIYTFLYPILSPDSLEKSNQIWCAADKAKAWNDWMVDGKAPGRQGGLRYHSSQENHRDGPQVGDQRHADDLLRGWGADPWCHSSGQDRAEARPEPGQVTPFPAGISGCCGIPWTGKTCRP